MVHVLGYETSVPQFLSIGAGLSLGLTGAGAVDWPLAVELPGLLACITAFSMIPKVVDAFLWRGRRRSLHTSSWQSSLGVSYNPARRLTADNVRFFDDLHLLVTAMKSIEQATAGRALSANLCSPAWVSLWFATGGPAIPAATMERMAAGWQAAQHALVTLPAEAVSHVTELWTDRTWWPRYLRSADAYAELARVAELISGRRVVYSEDSEVADSPASKPDALSRPAPPVAQSTDLEPVRLVHQEVREAFTSFCFDPHAVLARPLLNDVSDDLTAAFYLAQEAADEAETALEARHDDAKAAERYRDAVHVLAKAWDAADLHARECGVSHLSTAEQNDVRKARRTLDLALNPNTPAGEREAAYRAVLALISGLVKVPAPAMARMTAQIEHVRRLQLTAGGPSS